MSWAERAQAWRERTAFEAGAPPGLQVVAATIDSAAQTVSGVLGVHTPRLSENTQGVSGVLGVAPPRVSEKRDARNDGAGVYRLLHDAGLSIRLDGGQLTVTPEAGLDDALREVIGFHRHTLTRFLMGAERTAVDLVAAAMRACDHHDDGPAAREAMRAECLATPLHLQPDLLEHFRSCYPEPEEDGGG